MSRSNDEIIQELMSIGSTQSKPRAQYGLGFRFSNPYEATNIPVDALNAYVGTKLEAKGFQYREDGTQRYDDKRVDLLSNLSAGMSAMVGLSNMYGQNRDNKRELERLRRVRDDDYYNVPMDRYAYNSQAQNARQNTFYQAGGMIPESTFYQLHPLPVNLPQSGQNNGPKFLNAAPDTTLAHLTGERASNYQAAIDEIENNRIKMAMKVGKANVAMTYGANILDNAPIPTRKFRYRERKSGGYEFQDGGQVQDEVNFYETVQDETFDSTFDDAPDPDFFLNGEPEGIDFSNYKPKLAHEHQELPISPVLEKLKSMGLKPSSVNTGVHSVNSAHYHGKAVDLGINTTFGGDYKKMAEFKRWFEANGQREFPGVTLSDETVKPKGTARGYTGPHFHLHIK